MPGENENVRLQQTIESAFAESAVIEEKEQIEAALKSIGGEWSLDDRWPTTASPLD